MRWHARLNPSLVPATSPSERPLSRRCGHTSGRQQFGLHPRVCAGLTPERFTTIAYSLLGRRAHARALARPALTPRRCVLREIVGGLAHRERACCGVQGGARARATKRDHCAMLVLHWYSAGPTLLYWCCAGAQTLLTNNWLCTRAALELHRHYVVCFSPALSRSCTVVVLHWYRQ